MQRPLVIQTSPIFRLHPNLDIVNHGINQISESPLQYQKFDPNWVFALQNTLISDNYPKWGIIVQKLHFLVLAWKLYTKRSKFLYSTPIKHSNQIHIGVMDFE